MLLLSLEECHEVGARPLSHHHVNRLHMHNNNNAKQIIFKQQIILSLYI